MGAACRNQAHACNGATANSGAGEQISPGEWPEVERLKQSTWQLISVV